LAHVGRSSSVSDLCCCSTLHERVTSCSLACGDVQLTLAVAADAGDSCRGDCWRPVSVYSRSALSQLSRARLEYLKDPPKHITGTARIVCKTGTM